MAEGDFRLPGSSYEELANIIMAYGTRDEAANPGDVSKLDAVHRSSVTRTNGFLVEIGVLRGEREKLVTKRGRELALSLERRDGAEIRDNWRQIVSTSEFLQNVVSAVKLREGMLYSTIQAYIAHAAGQPRNKPVMIGSSTVIEILKASGLLHEDATGQLSATYAEEGGEEPPVDEDFLDSPEFSISPEDHTASPTPNPTLNIHLHVRCDAEELEDVAPKLKSLLKDLRDDLPAGANLRGDVKRTPRPEDFEDDFQTDFLEENANPPRLEEEFDGDFGEERRF